MSYFNKWKILDYIFVQRPVLLIPGWTTMLAGYYISKPVFPNTYSDVQYYFPEYDIIVLLLSFGLAMGGCFVINQIVDRESDAYNNKLFLISRGYVASGEAYRLSTILIVLSLLCAFYINLQVFITIGLFILITGYFYNYPPFSAKDKPFSSLISNSLMGILAFAIGWLSNHSVNIEFIFDLFPYMAFNTALYFFTTLPDREGDRRSKKNTLAVLFGNKLLIRFSFIVFIAGYIWAIFNNELRSVSFMSLTLPFFMWALIKNDQASAVRTTKFGILFFSLTVCLIAPWYLYILVGIFFLSKWYFKYRFSFNYPNFKG